MNKYRPARNCACLTLAVLGVLGGLTLTGAAQDRSAAAVQTVTGNDSSPQPSQVDQSQSVVRSSPTVEAAVHQDVSPPLYLIPPAPRQAGQRVHPVKPIPRPVSPITSGAVDPVVQESVPTILAPAPALNFDGIGKGFTGPAGTFTVNHIPPDTNGDVGPNHYVQIVNTDFAIFNKSGTAIYGPVLINTLWSGFGGLCQTDNDGDPVVLYDPIADRWVISQLAVTGANGTTTPFLECVAVSQTPDPTGAYNRYSFGYNSFNDYPKMGVWPDAYYITFNFFDATVTTFLHGEVCAYDRTNMLAGTAATQQCFNVGASFGGLLPADLDGAQQPPAGSPNYVLALGVSNNDLAFWKFHVDWTTPANTTLTGPTTLTVGTYAAACGGGTCIPQLGTTQQLDSLGDRLMFRLAYRNFGDHEALVANHSVVAGSSVGVRWYEIRTPGTTPTIFQQGTYAPDSNYRWMGSIAMDQSGSMALGFSISGSAIRPGIHYTGRLATDPLGTMQAESTLMDGAGSQLPRTCSGHPCGERWGDYSMMAVDPSDDCTFWYTNEYIPSDGTFNWKTRIGTFKFPGCGNPVPTLTSLSQTSVTAGGPPLNLTLTGMGFVNGSMAQVNGVAVATMFISATSLSATIPANDLMTAGNLAITVFNPAPGGGTSNSLTLTVDNPLPMLTSLSPASVAAGSPALTLTVNGTGFANGCMVQYNGSSLQTTFLSSISVTAVIPMSALASPGTLQITVVNPMPGGGTSGVLLLNVVSPNPVPTLTSLSPSSVTAGAPGLNVTLTGSGFINGSLVQVNAAPVTTTFNSASSLSAMIPAGDLLTSGNLAITVFNPAPGGGTSGSLTLSVANPLPMLTSLSQDFVIAGSPPVTLTLTGTNFVNGCMVQLGGTSLATTFNSSTSATAVIPMSALVNPAGSLQIAIANPPPGGGFSNVLILKVLSTNPVPTLTALLPTSVAAGSTGLSLAATGTNFATSAMVQVNGMSVSTTFNSSTSLTAAIPAANLMTGATLSITVVNPAPGGGLSNMLSLSVLNPVPMLTALSQTSVLAGSAGFNLTVTGANFLNGASVQVNGANLSPSSGTATSLTVAIPASLLTAAGSLSITVTNPPPNAGASSPLMLSVTDVTLSSPSGTQTVTAGQTANFTINVGTQGGALPSAENFTCTTGVPTAAACSFNPASIPAGTTSASTALMITTMTRSSVPSRPLEPPRDVPPALLWLLGSTLYAWLFLKRLRFAPRAGLAIAVLMLAFLTACGGGTPSLSSTSSGGAPHGTPAGTYMITVTASSGMAARSTTVTLQVN